ncbi:MAG: SMP-30/gluconolactonase/LRE family protein, partial [Paraglaciecola chathamensis]
MKFLTLSLLVLVALLSYLLFWPVPVEPVAWQAPKNPGYLGLYASNTKLANLESISLDGQHGPEDFALK